MKVATLVIPESIAAPLRAALQRPDETGAVLLARAVNTVDDGVRLLAREIHFVPDEAYARRSSYELLITSDGYVPALQRADETRAVPIWVHTHPGIGSSPVASRHDVVVNRELTDLFRLRADSPYFGALILAPHGNTIAFTGHIEDDAGETTVISRLLVIGERISISLHHEAAHGPISSMFDRSVRAFGGDIQRTLQELKVAIVGCGGTGSAVAEQLTRLGVRDFVLVDPDTLSASNVTRVYGSTPDDVGRHKVDVLAGHVQAIAPTARVRTHCSMVTLEPTARALAGVDLIFGCTDDNAGRLVLSRLATYLLQPVIDCGVLLSSSPTGTLEGIYARVTVLHPGAACLVCRDRIDLDRARSEMLTPEERVRLADEGYAPALPGVEPAVVAFTTMAAAAAVGELLERLIGYGPAPVPNEVLLRVHDRETSTNVCAPRAKHYCDPSAGKLGVGITNPFLEQVWPT